MPEVIRYRVRNSVASLNWDMSTYDGDKTLEGFKLILFLVWASGTGMLWERND